MPRNATPRSYALTANLVTTHAGSSVTCLDASSIGRSYRLHARRPDAALNLRARDLGEHTVEWRADVPSGANHSIAAVATPGPALIRVDISGPLEQRAGYHDECGGWSDGHDAVAERLCAALSEADVLMVVDSPGGAAAGLQQAVARTLAAKSANGRRVTVWADEQIGSAAMWWAAAIGDEIFVPPAGAVGSIGARAEHLDVSEAMAKEGLRKTYFADPPEKVALAPEFPLSPIGAARGARDVKAMADAFRAAVCAGPLGVRRALTPEYLTELGADMLMGQAAVDAGLADGVANFEEVTAYALTQAGREESTVREKAHGAANAS